MDQITRLPEKIFFTGAPGSRWSGIAQLIESLDGMNITDRSSEREYYHNAFSGHRGVYFGEQMEFEANPSYNVRRAYTDPESGCMVAKSHDWSYDLQGIKTYQSLKHGDWIMLVYRPELACQSWWNNAGGFNITYPNYSAYKDNANMLYQIQQQNNEMLRFAYIEQLVWSSFNSRWVQDIFDQELTQIPEWDDVLVTMYKPKS